MLTVEGAIPSSESLDAIEDVSATETVGSNTSDSNSSQPKQKSATEAVERSACDVKINQTKQKGAAGAVGSSGKITKYKISGMVLTYKLGALYLSIIIYILLVHKH